MKGLAAGLTKLQESGKLAVTSDTAPPKLGLDEPAELPPPPDVAVAEPEAAPAPAPVEEAPDAQTAKALAQIDKAAKKHRDEVARAKAELELERAELARLRSETTGKVSSWDELKKLKPIEVLEKLGIEAEDDYDLIAREAYARTKAGKADPRAKAAAETTARERDLMRQVDELKKGFDEIKGEFQNRDKAAETRSYVETWQTQAVKAIPAEPSLIGKLYEKSPEKAKAILLQIGQHLERQNDNETPSHAEVIAAYEKYRREELEEQGVDVDALLAVRKAAPKDSVSRTLDVTSAGGTRPANGTLSKAERIAQVAAGLRKLT